MTSPPPFQSEASRVPAYSGHLREQIACYLAFLADPSPARTGFDTDSSRSEQTALARRFLDYLEREPRPYHRASLAGHVTASACLASRDLSHILLLHHAKLGKWLQPGGHCDGDSDTVSVALREAREETALEGLVALSPAALGKGSGALSGVVFPLDLDVHGIPARGAEPAHLHWDVRYLVVPGDMAGPVAPTPLGNEESSGIAWVRLDALEEYTREESVLRLGRKLAFLAWG